MNDNVLIAIIAASGVVISAICVLGGAIFACTASNKRLDKIDTELLSIRGDLKEFFRLYLKLEAKVDAKQGG